MANEATLRTRFSLPVNAQCNNADAFEKGQVLWLTDANKVSGSNAINVAFGGICASEKITNDGKTQVAVYRGKGNIFDAKITSSVSGSKFVARGQLLKISGLNTFAAISGGNLAEPLVENQIASGFAGARALEDASDGEVILVELI